MNEPDERHSTRLHLMMSASELVNYEQLAISMSQRPA
jgi:hypothetical protein